MTLAAHPSPTPFPRLSGYTISEELYAGSRTRVYRAVEEISQRSVIIKLLQQEYPTFDDLLHFRNQYTIAKALDLPGIVRPYSLEPYGNSYALVMQDFGGISLQKYARQYSLSLSEVLTISLQLSMILYDLHQQRVIHKDLKPANILIHPTSKQVKLIDFSIASLLPRETQEIQNPNSLEGTLAYLAPEQTGRMNRGIDYRSDFYAFGVTLYELLTGQLPFQSEDPMELVHCHLAKLPIAPHDLQLDIPVPVSKMVLKLMAKNAEDRYQSAVGLQHDLQICLTQLKETGGISAFEIGTRDISDRFLIPEKLYGREAEVQVLLDAFDRVAQGQSELMLVAGFSGIGKTAVINEVHKPIVKQRGYFIKGKFDQFNRNIPFSAFVQAFRDLMGQLLSESDEQLHLWKAQILHALGENAQVMIEVIPELERIIGAQPPAPELSGSAAQNRFNLLLQKFIHIFTTPEHPLVMFLDDLQWADSASLNLLKLLMVETSVGYLLILGAYRDNEVFPAHPLMLVLEEIQKEAMLNTITLTPLGEMVVNQLVADTLSCPEKLAQPLTQLVYRKTKGNPFFTTQLLKALYEEGCIQFQPVLRYWQCDLTAVRQFALTDDVVEFLAVQLQKLPIETQEVLKLAACIGNQFDLNTLAIVSEQSQSDTATALWKALQEGLILPLSETYKFFQSKGTDIAQSEMSVPYKFLHDRVQQAAYTLIPNQQKQATHLKIGQLLLSNTPEEQRENRIFDIVNQLNMGIELIDDPSHRVQLIQLNLIAGQKAKVATAYTAAVNYLRTGLAFLSSDSWQHQYDLTLSLYELLAETEYLNTNFEASEDLIRQGISNARNALDKVRFYEIQIQSYTAQNRLIEAIDSGRSALDLIGIDFPQGCDFETTIAQHQQLKLLLGDRSIETLADLPNLSDLEHLAALRILAGLFASVYLAKPNLLPLKIFTMVKICIQHGNSPQAAIAYSLYALFLCATGEIEHGYQFGQLATTVLEQLQAKELTSKVNLLFGLFVKHWKTSIRSTLPIFLAGLTSGLEYGDLEYVGYCANCYAQFLFWTREDLEIAESEAAKYCDLIQTIKQEASLIWANTWRQTVVNLRGNSANPTMLIGSCFNELETLPALIQSRNVNGICYVYLAKLLLAYLFEESEKAKEYARKFEEYEQGAAGLLIIPLKNFYQSLSLLSSSLETEDTEKVPATVDLEKVIDNQKSMKVWAESAPMNYLHKFHLVEAEIHRVLGKHYEAGDAYDRAIANAKENGFIQDEALANELAAKFYLNWGKDKLAALYMQEAYYCYSRWGAKAKTDDLERRHPALLSPILQQAAYTLNPFETLASLTTPNLAGGALTQVNCASSTSMNTILDFAAILKASQSLSSAIQLDELLHQLTQIILQHSGGDRCVLICPNSEGKWQVIAIATPEGTELCSEPLEGNPNLPVKLVQYVKHTQESVVIDNLQTDLPVIDEYLIQRQPKSVLCFPILNQGKLIGILYLKNRVARGVFTHERILILNFLCTQAAISLENARLYQQAQTYVQQLEQSQLQIVQSEKMASLGNLVAGVAHEINNPIGFLTGSINNAKDFVQDLLGHLALYQQHYSNPVPEIQTNAEDLDLEFLCEDLPKLLDSMKGATDRIRSISTSLRTFSRADTEHKVRADLHEGIDSTLLILKYRLKANEHRPAIQVIQEYGELPAIDCFPGRLNQVFMNIFANAIDAFDETAQSASFADLEANPQHIEIQTQIVENQVEIRIRDNGKGMDEALQARIFDHLFTTKGVGKGTGLGLAIARQIVEEKHGGKILVHSSLEKGTEFLIQLPV